MMAPKYGGRKKKKRSREKKEARFNFSTGRRGKKREGKGKYGLRPWHFVYTKATFPTCFWRLMVLFPFSFTGREKSSPLRLLLFNIRRRKRSGISFFAPPEPKNLRETELKGLLRRGISLSGDLKKSRALASPR